LSLYNHFSIVFDEELIKHYVKYLRDMLDTMVDFDIKDKEEFIKKLMKLFCVMLYIISA
jgi:hypothetical protein